MSEPRDIYELDEGDRTPNPAHSDRPNPDSPDALPSSPAAPDPIDLADEPADQPANDLPEVELLSSTPVASDPPATNADTFDLADPSDPDAHHTPDNATATPAPEIAQASDPAYDLAQPHPDDEPAARDEAGFTPGVAGGKPLPKGTLPTRPTRTEPLLRDGPIFAELERFCLTCGYSLRGLHEPRCPECGAWFDPERPTTYYAKGEVSTELRRQDKSIRVALLVTLAIVGVSGLPLIFFSGNLLGGPLPWLGHMLVVIPWSAMCCYAALWLVEHDRLVSLAGYLATGVAMGVGLGIVAALVTTVAHLAATHSFAFEPGHLLLGAMGGVFAAFVRSYNALSLH
ncbi:MAG: hypothetical protein AAF823_13240 [Planctomycetota bacterium]